MRQILVGLLMVGLLALGGLALVRWVDRLPVCDLACQADRAVEELQRAIQQEPGR